MITVISFAIGEKYLEELNHMIASVLQHNKKIDVFIGRGREKSNEMILELITNGFYSKSYLEFIDVGSDRITDWNRIGMIKAWMIKTAMLHCRSDIYLWLDADARVRGDISCLDDDLDDEDFGLSYDRDAGIFNAGTIAIRKCWQTLKIVDDWWNACKMMMRRDHIDDTINDQSILRNILSDSKYPMNYPLNLGEKWCSIAPLIGTNKKNPPITYPNRSALIWHWQASRGVRFGSNWPPHESVRPR